MKRVCLQPQANQIWAIGEHASDETPNSSFNFFGVATSEIKPIPLPILSPEEEDLENNFLGHIV